MSDRRVFAGALGHWWRHLGLVRKYLYLGACITFLAMLFCGLLTTSFLTEIVLARRGEIVATLLHYQLKPIVARLADTSTADAAALAQLEALRQDAIFAEEFPHFDIWLSDGTLFYSTTEGLAGERLNAPDAIERAFGGDMSVRFSDKNSAEYQSHHLDRTYIEIFVPLRNTPGGDVVAVLQLREVTTSLERDLFNVMLSSWIVVALVTSLIMVVLFSVVLEGSRKIERQGQVLARRLNFSHKRAARNRELKVIAQSASRNLTDATDRYLRSIGTDLHDGPAQSIAFAVLRLDSLRRLGRAAQRDVVISEIEAALGDSLGEIRTIASNLVLPEIEGLTLPEIIERALQQHKQRTNDEVILDSRVTAVHVSPEVAICTYRFLQEGLNNAHRHGENEGKSVSANLDAGVLKVAIANTYSSDAPVPPDELHGIGLFGLRARVISLGGKFLFERENGKARLEMAIRHV